MRPTPSDLQAALRALYPNGVVHQRERLAKLTDDEEAWYVYRDGRYVPAADDESWDDPSIARVVIGEDRGYLEANDAALKLLGITREELAHARSGDFTTQPIAQQVGWVFGLLEDEGIVDSTSVLVPRRGDPRSVRFHLVLDGDGPGRHVCLMRPIVRRRAEARAG
ncbi:MAG: hypothetical protein ACJ761_00915 [Chloroflexota bacterium]